jgi:signal peptidase I
MRSFFPSLLCVFTTALAMSPMCAHNAPQSSALQAPEATAVLALSDSPGLGRGTRSFTPSSSLTVPQAEQIARVVALIKPGASICTVLPTGSMKPFFDEKAILLMENAPFDQLKVGDVVTYWHPRLGVLVAHRLVAKDGDRFWAKGDANSRSDNVYVTRANYLKRVFAVIYTGGE